MLARIWNGSNSQYIIEWLPSDKTPLLARCSLGNLRFNVWKVIIMNDSREGQTRWKRDISLTSDDGNTSWDCRRMHGPVMLVRVNLLMEYCISLVEQEWPWEHCLHFIIIQLRRKAGERSEPENFWISKVKMQVFVSLQYVISHYFRFISHYFSRENSSCRSRGVDENYATPTPGKKNMRLRLRAKKICDSDSDSGQKNYATPTPGKMIDSGRSRLRLRIPGEKGRSRPRSRPRSRRFLQVRSQHNTSK